MWPHVMPSRNKRGATSRTPTRRPRWNRPLCMPLEERCLLSVTLTETSGPPVPYVGGQVVWTATTNDEGTSPVYQFSAGPDGGVLTMIQDFGPSNTFMWNPLQEGTYDVKVTVKDSYTDTVGESAIVTYTAQTRIVGTSPVITPMANPLVALYSAPPSSGSSMHVEFAQQASYLTWQSTAPQAIVPGESTNFIVAGMLPDTTYLMRYVTDDGTASAPMAYTTGSIPTSLVFPTFTVDEAPTAANDMSQNIVLHSEVANAATTTSDVTTLATNLSGQVIWYYDPSANDFAGYPLNLEPNGVVPMLGGTATGVAGGFDTIRVTDLAGDTLQQTNINAVNAELAAMGQAPIIDFDHDVKELPSGDWAVIASTQKTVNYQGVPTLYTGDMVLVLDHNFQVNWAWNSFNYLNTNRLGTDGEGPDDWLHGNSIDWSPADGDLVVSLRAQDWVINIDYANGTGDGHIVWKLGNGGDFTIVAPGQGLLPWFSHQHDFRFINPTTVVVFDDGNTRWKYNQNIQSRGQEYVLNYQAMTATLVVNANLGDYSSFLGAAEALPNGNLVFMSGGQGTLPNYFGQTIEIQPDGTQTYVLQSSGYEYRSYTTGSLYNVSMTDSVYTASTTVLDRQISDDGDSTTSSTKGSWATNTTTGYQGGEHTSAAGTGSSVATWILPVVPGQTYNLSATWSAAAGNADNAPFKFYTGLAKVGSAAVDEKVAPSGYIDAGGSWNSLGTFVATSSTLTVTLSNKADGTVVADAIRLQRVVDQQISDDNDSTFSTLGSWSVSSAAGYDGSVHQAQAGSGTSAATWTFSVVPGETYNLGATWTAASGNADNAPYTITSGKTVLGTPAVDQKVAPAGFSATYGTWQLLGTFVATGSTLTVTLSNHADGTVIADAMLLETVAPSQVEDNVDPAWTSVGPWPVQSTGGFAGNTASTPAGTGANTATWTIGVVPGQTYSVATTWTVGLRANNAPYTIASGGTTLGTVLVNQKVAPSSFSADGRKWQSLGSFVAAGPTLTVTLTNNADGIVVADAILVQLAAGPSSAAALPGASSVGGLAVSSVAATGGPSRILGALSVAGTTTKGSSGSLVLGTTAGIVDQTQSIAVPAANRNLSGGLTGKPAVILGASSIRRTPVASRLPRVGSLA